jgi:hypothetical protein
MSKRRIGYQVWCDDCACRYGEEIAWWEESGWAVARFGRLRVAVECDVCDAPVAVGEPAAALTFVYGEPEEYWPWEEQVLEVDESVSEA